jgi:predicted RNA-binding protein with RPS1 domain
MSEPTPTPENTPATPDPTIQPLAASPQPDPAAPATPAPAGPAKPQAAPARGKRPFRGDKPKQDRPKLDFTELSVDLKINELDKDIEADLAAAMSGFETELKEDTEAAKQKAIQAAQAPKEAGGRKKGRVISIHGGDVFVDVPGGRSQGFLPITQFDTPPKVGDEVEFSVEGYDAANGVLRLTRSGAAQRVDWSSVQIGQTVEARVTGTNKGGLSVEVNGIRGFMPIGQIDMYRVENVEQYVNQKIICMVAEVVPEERNLVVSRKALLERERERLREKFWAEVEEGQVLKGTVRGIQPFGAFVDLGGADGLLPVSEISWARVGSPSDILSIGQPVGHAQPAGPGRLTGHGEGDTDHRLRGVRRGRAGCRGTDSRQRDGSRSWRPHPRPGPRGQGRRGANPVDRQGRPKDVAVDEGDRGGQGKGRDGCRQGRIGRPCLGRGGGGRGSPAAAEEVPVPAPRGEVAVSNQRSAVSQTTDWLTADR